MKRRCFKEYFILSFETANPNLYVACSFLLERLLMWFTVGVIRNETLVFVNFSAQDASILKISVPIIKRRSWGFQNTPNLQNSDYFELSYGNLKKMEDLQKLVWLIDLEGHTVFCCFLSQNSSESWFLGVFRNLQDLLLLMGTEIFKIDAEMAEKIEVEVGNPLLKSDRKAGKWFLC